MDWICPAYNLVLSQQLLKYYGQITPQLAIANITAVEQSGDNHLAYYVGQPLTARTSPPSTFMSPSLRPSVSAARLAPMPASSLTLMPPRSLPSSHPHLSARLPKVVNDLADGRSLQISTFHLFLVHKTLLASNCNRI
jgi:hypothetical protein